MLSLRLLKYKGTRCYVGEGSSLCDGWMRREHIRGLPCVQVDLMEGASKLNVPIVSLDFF